MRSNTPERAAAEIAEREAALLAAGHTVVGATPSPASPDPSQPVIDLTHLMERPDVQALVAATVADSVAKILADLEAKRAVAQSAPQLTDRQFGEHLALSIAQLIDQGRPGGKRVVAPEVMAMRANAHEKMVDLLLEARARGLQPEYEAVGASYLSEELIPATWVGSDHKERPSRFFWPSIPNQAMRPMNDIAAEIHRLFRESIGVMPQPAPNEPLVAGFRVIREEQVPETGHGSVGIQHLGRDTPGTIPEAHHILGTVADPARSTVPGR